MNRHRFNGKSAYYRLLRSAECGYHRELLIAVHYHRHLLATYQALKGRTAIAVLEQHRRDMLTNLGHIRRLYKDFKE